MRVKQQLTPIVETEMELLRDKMKEVKEQEQALLEQEFERRYAQKRDMLMQNSVNTKQQIETEHMKTDKGADMTNLGFTGYMAGFYIDSLAEYRKKIEDHPQEYAQNRQVIDTVYQQLFRSYDAIGDVHLKQMAAEYVSDDVKVLSEQDMTYVEKQMNRLASRNSGEAENDIVVLTEQTNGMLDILRSLLENKPMTEAGSQMMRQLGF